MKKLFVVATAMVMLLATSCKKDQNAPENVALGGNEFLATIDNGANPQNVPRVKDGMSQMTTINGNDVFWESGDIIYINGSAYTTNTSGTSVVFSGGNATGSTFHAFYGVENPSATEASAVLPAIQTYESGYVRNLPMYATCGSDHVLTFHNICAALKIELPSYVDGATKIEVMADKAINGAFAINNNAAVMNVTGDTYKTVTVAKEGNAAFATGEVVYIALPAAEYESLNIKFYNGNGIIWSKTVAATLVANHIYNINMTPTPNYFCFTALSDNDVTIKMVAWNKGGSAPSVSLQYSTDLTNWNNFTVGTTTITLANTGDKVYFKANGANDKLGGPQSYNSFYATGGDVEVSGNIMYLLNGTTPATDLTSTNTCAFAYLFCNMSKLKDATDLILPAENVVSSCYRNMFMGCSNLENAPELPAATLAPSCYYQMFESCARLQKVTMLATNVSASNAMDSWLNNAGTKVTNPTVYVASGMRSTIQGKVPDNWAVTEVSSQP